MVLVYNANNSWNEEKYMRREERKGDMRKRGWHNSIFSILLSINWIVIQNISQKVLMYEKFLNNPNNWIHFFFYQKTIYSYKFSLFRFSFFILICSSLIDFLLSYIVLKIQNSEITNKVMHIGKKSLHIPAVL